MDDLVARLREAAGKYDDHCGHENIELEAADEIERLRAALRGIESVGSQYSVKSGPAYAMRNIARAALAGEKAND